jgi:hypothetical protein
MVTPSVTVTVTPPVTVMVKPPVTVTVTVHKPDKTGQNQKFLLQEERQRLCREVRERESRTGKS